MSELKIQLRDLHALLLRVRDLREEAEAAARRRKRLAAKIDAAKKALDDHLGALKQLKVDLHEKEVSLKANQERIGKYTKQRQTITDKKQYDALTHEIDNVKQECNVLEEAALTAMASVDELNAKTPTLEEALKQAQAGAAQFEAESKAELDSHAARLAEAEATLKQAEAVLEGDAKRHYGRVAPSLGADALAPTHRKSCTGCNMEMTGQQANDLLAGRLVVCKSCSRILYDPNG